MKNESSNIRPSTRYCTGWCNLVVATSERAITQGGETYHIVCHEKKLQAKRLQEKRDVETHLEIKPRIEQLEINFEADFEL